MYPEFAKEINSRQMQNKNKNKKDFGYESVCVCKYIHVEPQRIAK